MKHLTVSISGARRLALLLLICLSACQAVAPEPPPTAALPTDARTATLTATRSPTPTVAPSASPLPPTADPTPAPAFQVQVHPDGGLYVGDLVSFEVVAPPAAPGRADPDGHTLNLSLPTADGEMTVQAQFGRYGIGGRAQAVFLWAWNTGDLPPGDYALRFRLLPGGPEWSQWVRLAPAGQRPANEANVHWAAAHSQCCSVQYMTHTEAERDLPVLLEQIDQQAADAAQRMGVKLDEPITIVLLPRVLGHGGFAGREIAVSYLDRNYMSGATAFVVHHELIHILDGKLGGDYRPTALVEGLAVYQSGGHFKPEPLAQRAAAMLAPEPGCQPWPPKDAAAEGCGIDRYIPLERLFDNFYFEQHEIGYLEAASLIDFMAHTWGYPAFDDFYRHIRPPQPPDGKPSESIEASLQAHFGLGVEQLEARFLAYLRQQDPSPAQAEDLRQSVQFFDTARHYQQVLDPSAYFLNAWLLDSEQMRQKGVVADYIRRPAQPENLALETMLSAADEAVRRADFAQAGRLLAAVEATLQAYPAQGLAAFQRDPLAADYLGLVQAALAAGYQPQRIRIENQTARVWGSQSGPQVSEMVFMRQGPSWALQ